MTAGELVALADRLAPNPFDEDIKLGLVNEIEAKIFTELLLTESEDFEPIAQANMATAELSLPESRRSLYIAWMRTMLYWYMGEYDTYANEKAMFDNEWLLTERELCIREHRGTG